MKKKILAALLAVAMLAGMLCLPAMAADEGTFPDVDGEAWYAGAVERWAGNGILNGKDDGNFDPTGSMKRSEFAKVIVELLGLPHDSTEMSFTDVKEDHWAAGWIAAAHEAGIINGKGDGTKFAPDDPVSFNESATMLGRALGLFTVEESSGANFNTKAVETLTELGMLDDHVNADAEPNRALVAALADNMIGAYVTPDTVDSETEDGVITGEVTGVILVRGDVKVEIKDITTAAPIVVDSASVTLTGVTAGEVKVIGENAAVTADKDSKVENVSIAATDAKVELNGTVEKVTVEAEAAGDIEITGDGVTADTVDNTAATTDITVKGETMEKPDESEKPDDNQGESSGYIPEPVTPPADSTESTGGAAATDRREQEESEEAGDTTISNATCTDAEGHAWSTSPDSEASIKATCTEDGANVYKCTNDGCTETKTVVIEALGHDFENSTRDAYDGTNHWTYCKYCNVKDGEESHNLTYTKSGDTKHTAKCDCGYTVTEAHTWDEETYTKTAMTHAKKCSVCDLSYATGTHTWGDWTEGSVITAWADLPVGTTGKPTAEDADVSDYVLKTRDCDVCGYEQNKVVAKPAEGGEEGPGTDTHEHTYATEDWTYDSTQHWHACNCASDSGCPLTAEEKAAKPETATTANGLAAHGTLVAKEAGATDTQHKMGCSKCGYVSDTPEDHNWATVSAPTENGMKTCSDCHKAVACTGDPNAGTPNAGHGTAEGTCEWCGATYEAPVVPPQ